MIEDLEEAEAPAADCKRPVHLHCHSEYSLLDGAIKIADLVTRAKELGHDAVAITDHGNLFGAVEFFIKAKAAGVKAIIGSEVFTAPNEKTQAYFSAVNNSTVNNSAVNNTTVGGSVANSSHLVLLAKDNCGYKNLIKIVSSGYLEGRGEVPVASLESIAGQNAESGLIALSACAMGEFGLLVAELRRLQNIKAADLGSSASSVLDLDSKEDPVLQIKAALDLHVATMHERVGTGNYYIELIDNNIEAQKNLIADLVVAAKHYDLPLVCSADAHYLKEDQASTHAVLLGIKHGLTMTKLRGRRKDTTFHLYDNDEMEQRYGRWPAALQNTRKIAEQCDVTFKFGEFYLPQFDLGTGEGADDGLVRIAKEMLEERFVQLRKLHGKSFDQKREAIYHDRLKYELGVILKMGFPGYFLIVQDFINWSKRHDIPVGPGRGSGAGSLVAYALRITDIDPIPYNLLFERFLNPDRISMPDFDVDFCQDRRDEVIRYVAERYGADNVAQITTFGRMLAKGVVRDVGRVLELGFMRVDKIARLIPEELGITLKEAIEKEPRIKEEADRDENVAELLRVALSLEGLARHTSVHAAGVVISDGPMTDYVPVHIAEENGGLITQFEMKMAEKVGLVKFDFLGLKTLTVIQKAIKYIHAERDADFDIALIPMGDKKVYNYISAGHTAGLFQLESTGMRALVLKLKPSCFEDIIALVALFRPGPLGSGMVDDFIERKHGRQEINYPVPQLEEVLRETYGTILYQEQVMKIAGELASYTLGEADLLRRAMGKKDAAEMERQKIRFRDGAVKNGIPEAKAVEIFDLMAEFAKYGFNKSHSAAYGLVSYQTAYLKVHYPAEFMAAIMTCDLDNTAKIVRYVDEVRRLKLNLVPPSINTSSLDFDVPAPKTIGFGLAAIKGIGAAVLEPIVSERQTSGAYKNLTDLARRVNLGRVGKKNPGAAYSSRCA